MVFSWPSGRLLKTKTMFFNRHTLLNRVTVKFFVHRAIYLKVERKVQKKIKRM